MDLTNERILEIVEIIEKEIRIRKGSICYHLLNEGISKEEVKDFKNIIANVFIKHSSLFGPQCLTETVKAYLQIGKADSISADLYIFVNGENGYKGRLYLLKLIKEKYEKSSQLAISY